MTAAAAMKPSEALRKARDLITPDGAWTQGENARTANGIEVSPKNPAAVCFCVEGACIAVTRDRWMDSPRNIQAWKFLKKATGENVIYVWNDNPNRTHAEVLDAFTNAIALAEAESK